jgi:hypothetical protein
MIGGLELDRWPDADADADADAEFEIEIAGLVTLVEADFVL